MNTKKKRIILATRYLTTIRRESNYCKACKYSSNSVVFRSALFADRARIEVINNPNEN